MSSIKQTGIKQTGIKQSVCWGPFSRPAGGIDALINAALEIGFKSIEMAPPEHWRAIKDAGLEIAIFVGHKSLQDGLNKRENHDRIEAELRASIKMAAEYHIPSILTLSGNRYEGISDEEGVEISAACLKRVISMAEDYGITLCTELLNSKVNHPGYQCDSTRWGVELCRAVDSPCCKLVYDIYHMQIMEGDLIRTITENIKYIGHFHTAGNPGRQNLDSDQEINYPAVMKAIADTGYEGYVGHEFRPKAGWREALEEAYTACHIN